MSEPIHIAQKVQHVGRMRLRPGLKGWIFDLSTCTISEMVIESRESRNEKGALNGTKQFTMVNPKTQRFCIARDRKNAERKFNNMLRGKA